MKETNALVLFSGGQDSATCVAWALEKFDYVETIGFDYRQRHRVELDVRQTFFEELRKEFPKWNKKLGQDTLVDMSALADLGQTAMTEDIAIHMQKNGLPNTFVPGRNLLFFTYAAALAYRRGCKNLVGGMCETDFSGYPDCRDDTLKSLQATINLGMGSRFVIHTPLMWIDKALTWALANALGNSEFVNLIIEHTHTCYAGDRTAKKGWGFGCGKCPACNLRKAGWLKWRSSLR